MLDCTNYLKFWMSEKIGNKTDVQETIRIATNIGVTSVLLDSYEVDGEYLSALGDAGFQTVYFEDMLNTDCLADVVVNGLIGAETLKYKSPHVLLGTNYLVLGSEYWNISAKPRENTGLDQIIITTGGIDHYDLTTRSINLLNRLDQPIHIHTVIGRYFDNAHEIEAAASKSRQKITLYHQPDGIADIIRNCQFAISAGGLTLYELAAFGVATVGVWLWENQRENVERLGHEGAILPLAYNDQDKFDEQLFNAIEHLFLNDQLRRNMARKGKKLVDGGGARRVANALMDLTK